MADKTVSIMVNDQEELAMTFKHVTEVSPSEELDSDTEDTFDGPVGKGTENPAYTIDISKLDLEAVDETGKTAMERYDLFKKILVALRTQKGTLIVSEVLKPKEGGAFKVTERYNNVLLSSNKHKISAKDLTARDLTFKAESRTDEPSVRV